MYVIQRYSGLMGNNKYSLILVNGILRGGKVE
jgi:hypothetical protein